MQSLAPFVKILVFVMWGHLSHWCAKTHCMRYIEIENKLQHEVHQCKYVVHMSCGTTIVVVGVHLNIHSYVIHAKACDT